MGDRTKKHPKLVIDTNMRWDVKLDDDAPDELLWKLAPAEAVGSKEVLDQELDLQRRPQSSTGRGRSRSSSLLSIGRSTRPHRVRVAHAASQHSSKRFSPG